VDDVRPLPRTLELAPGVPNPFERTTRLDYALPRDGHVKVTVHDLQGRRVATLADQTLRPGRYSATWDGRVTNGGRANAGVYFVRLEIVGATGSETRRRKIVMTR
jgi:flagellar hook assembly protein FlgD